MAVTKREKAWKSKLTPGKYKDMYRENLQAMIDAKIKGQEVVAPPIAEPAKVIDIMEALKQSLAIAKKPASSSTELNLVEAPSKKQRGPKRASG